MQKIAEDMQKDLEKIKEEARTQGEEKEAEMIAKAKAENNEESWRMYGEWRGRSRREVRRQKDWKRTSKTSRS